MQPWALYNEIDEYAADWLENLIGAGLIAPGVVDRRSIEDILADDIRGFRQVHWFAGIGVWSYALRRAGVSDDVALWTGSCPCQPFSAAGKGGGVDDERHLWPAWHHHIREHRPPRILGEQVASKDGLGWLDLVSSDLEAEGYAFGAVDTCSAGSGAPHIRQRLRFVAYDRRSAANRTDDADSGFAEQLARKWAGPVEANGWRSSGQLDRSGDLGRVGDNDNSGLEGFGGRHRAALGRLGSLRSIASAGEPGGMADAGRTFRFGRTHTEGSACDGAGERHQNSSDDQSRGSASRLPDAAGEQRDARRFGAEGDKPGSLVGPARFGAVVERANEQGDHALAGRIRRPGPTNGFWRDADWVFCRDGKWRPIEPGTFPLAYGAPSRVGRLRAYGNAVDAEATTDFILACIQEDEPDGAVVEGTARSVDDLEALLG